MSKDICIIGVYFGKFNNYFNLWLDSAARNVSIDFLIITDQKIEEKADNIKIVNMSFKELQKLIESKLNMRVNLKRAYKLCDFKPAYGYIFSDFIEGYNYWGHCDFDLIWGELRSFFEQYKYDQYDRFLDRGHLTLYRNIEKINSLFKTKVNGELGYRTIFNNGHNYLFDESNLLEKICVQENVKVFKLRLAADIDFVHKRLRHAFGNTELTQNYDHQVFYYENGHIYMSYQDVDRISRKEYMYIHLQKRNGLKLNTTDSNSYYITSYGFYDKNDVAVTRSIIDKYNPYHGEDVERKEREVYDSSMWKLKLKSKIARKPIGKIVVQVYNSVKYKFK